MRVPPLSPSGAVRARFGSLLKSAADPLALPFLRDAVGDGAFAAARELALCVPAEQASWRPAVMTLAAALLWTGERGSTRLPVGTRDAGPLVRALEELQTPDELIAKVFALLEEAELPVIGQGGDFRPLVIDGDAVSVQRFLALEEDLGARLRERLCGDGLAFVQKQVKAALADVLARAPRFGGAKVELSDEQQRAILCAAHLPLTVISGGPGTGKTSIVVSVLRMLLRLGMNVTELGLAAPTGKAANRMAEAIASYLRSIEKPSVEDVELLEHTPPPMTLHRLLGYSPSRDRFHHHAQNPLAQRVVIVDEASMIDLGLMNQLVRAVAKDARLVLLGDAEQLPSVDAGAVLRDLVPANVRPAPRPWDALVAGAAKSEPSDDLRDRAAVRLTKSYRMREDDPSGRAMYLVAQEVRAGKLPALPRRAVAELKFEAVELSPDSERAAFLDRWFEERVVNADFEALVRREYVCDGGTFSTEESAHLGKLFARLQESRLLCLTRSESRPAGTGSINRELHQRLLALLGAEDADDRFPLHPGEPVLMTHNDYDLGLFNGDQGVLLRVRNINEARHQLRFVFPVKGAFRSFERGALRHQVIPAWAMTVHKAQGSEFDHVALVLPDAEERKHATESSSLLVREIVYTAMTRARKSVTVVGEVEALEEAVSRSMERHSALSDDAFWSEKRKR